MVDSAVTVNGPFIIPEADIFLALESAPMDELFIGGCAEDLILTDEYEQRKIETPGIPKPTRKRINESHTIEMGNLWLVDLSTDPPVVAQLQDGVRYKMVITWTDNDTGVWAKRTYAGVTLRNHILRTHFQVSARGDRYDNQRMIFDADDFTEEAGVPE